MQNTPDIECRGLFLSYNHFSFFESLQKIFRIETESKVIGMQELICKEIGDMRCQGQAVYNEKAFFLCDSTKRGKKFTFVVADANGVDAVIEEGNRED